MPAIPQEPSWWAFWRRRACRRAGGHWWHLPDLDPMGDWACCACGARRGGMPKDGT